MHPGFQHFHPMDERFAGEIGLGTRHLHERELERKPGIGALTFVLEHDGEQVDEPEHGWLGKLIRLLAQTLAGLVGERQRVGHVTDVLDQQQLAQMLQELLGQLAEILPPLGQLLDEDERAGNVAIDDRVAQPEEHVLLDCRPEL